MVLGLPRGSRSPPTCHPHLMLPFLGHQPIKSPAAVAAQPLAPGPFSHRRQPPGAGGFKSNKKSLVALCCSIHLFPDVNHTVVGGASPPHPPPQSWVCSEALPRFSAVSGSSCSSGVGAPWSHRRPFCGEEVGTHGLFGGLGAGFQHLVMRRGLKMGQVMGSVRETGALRFGGSL